MLKREPFWHINAGLYEIEISGVLTNAEVSVLWRWDFWWLPIFQASGERQTHAFWM